MPVQTATPALAISGLHAGYDETAVLRDVSLVVPRSGVVALLGANGAGKTTLLRTVSGLVKADSGTVELHGRDITTDPPHQRAAAGLCHVPEGRGIFRSLTVRENLVLQSRPGDEAGALERAVGAFPVLGERLRQSAGTLSGGPQPTLVLVDEVSLGLGPLVVDEIFEFMRARAAEGTAILVVDQYAKRALELADTAYVLRKGEMVFSGTSKELASSNLFDRYIGAIAEK
jgi:branched-chain amino acid transport system ATP-binding protein